MQVNHVAACPEVSPTACETQDIPDHMHHQGIRWFRSTLGLSLGLGKGWQVHADLPVDLKVLNIEYSLDGDPYDPPYAGIHHRDETLFGLSDSTLSLQHYRGLPADLVLGLSLGTTLPLGKTEEDPFALAAQGKEHQHFQRGTGTFVPSGRIELFWMGLRWRAMGWVSAVQPLYESAHGYTPASNRSYGLTAGYRLTPDTHLMVSSQAQHIGPEAWGGDTSNTPGRDLVMGGLGALHVLKPGLVLQAQLQATPWQQTRSDHAEDEMVQRFLLTAGVSWTPGKAPEGS